MKCMSVYGQHTGRGSGEPLAHNVLWGVRVWLTVAKAAAD